MFKGKSTCKILKEIRQKIAEENDIALIVEECHYQGDCAGTCPRCESELRYLEEELRKRQQLGKAVVLTGLSVGLAISSVGCGSTQSSTKSGGNAQNSASQPTCQNEGRPITDALAPMGAIDASVTNKHKEGKKESVESYTLNEEAHSNRYDYEVMDFVSDTSKNNFNNFLKEDSIDTNSNDFMGMIESSPQFPGGPDSLNAFIDENIQYPESVLNGSVQGIVLVEFVVNKDGSVSDAKVKIPLSPECDAEAVRVVSLLPKWKPAEIKGEPVRSFYQVPVPFPRVNK